MSQMGEQAQAVLLAVSGHRCRDAIDSYDANGAA